MLAALTYHGIEHLFLVYRLSRQLGRILLWVMERDRVRLGYNGRAPGGMVGGVGVERGGISPRVHEGDAGESG